MTTKNRDHRSYDFVQKHLYGLILNTVIVIITKLDEPYTLKPSLNGLHGYSPKTMAMICILMEAERTTYRKIVVKIRANPTMMTKLGITDKIPTKSTTIALAYKKIPEEYLYMAHKLVMAAQDGQCIRSRQYRILNTQICHMARPQDGSKVQVHQKPASE